MADGINIGEKNGNWHGGVTITNRGYRKIVSKGHPRGGRDGYVLEHIRVMELSLGRYLDSEEVVHHKNGNKLDNRIENLELFASHTEHLEKGHNNFKKGLMVTCFTCGKEFYKKRCRITKYNFCSKAHVNPVWGFRRGGKSNGR